MELVVEAGRWRRERLPKAPLNDVFQDALMIRPLCRAPRRAGCRSYVTPCSSRPVRSHLLACWPPTLSLTLTLKPTLSLTLTLNLHPSPNPHQRRPPSCYT